MDAVLELAFPESSSRLDCLVELLRQLVLYKKGFLLPRPPNDWCRSTLVPLLKNMSDSSCSHMPAYVFYIITIDFNHKLFSSNNPVHGFKTVTDS